MYMKHALLTLALLVASSDSGGDFTIHYAAFDNAELYEEVKKQLYHIGMWSQEAGVRRLEFRSIDERVLVEAISDAVEELTPECFMLGQCERTGLKIAYCATGDSLWVFWPDTNSQKQRDLADACWGR